MDQAVRRHPCDVCYRRRFPVCYPRESDSYSRAFAARLRLVANRVGTMFLRDSGIALPQ
ncbi:hypothetical protein EMIT0111MI5_190016 [Burkholderia sp. IT-111MI5]